MYKAIVFAGTTEGYALCEFLAENHVPVYACAATEYGGSLLKENEFLHVSAGRLKTEDMEELFRREAPEIVLDATHPYAAEVTKNIRTACENGSIRYQRVLRPEGEKNREAIYVESTEKAAEFLSGTEGNIFLTTGSKELSKFTVIPDYQERLFARVLSIPSVISSCAELGIEGKHLIGMQGPFSTEINEAMLRHANNTSLEYNYPCQKDVGFFFFPVSVVHELVSMGKCSEMDIILDMWIHAIYNDPQVQGSDVGPVVYFRDHTGRPLITCRELALRWGLSKSSISRLLKKLESHEYLTVVSFTGTHGSVLYLQGYLSTMFSISDVMVDKEEVSLTFQLPVTLDDEASRCLSEADIGKSLADILPETEQIYVSDNTDSVPETHILKIIQKSAKVLAAQGVFCCECSKSKYKLYRLSACRRDIYRYSLQIGCSESNIVYHFELSIQPMLQSDPSIKFDDAVPGASPVQKQTTNSHEEEHYETDKQ